MSRSTVSVNGLDLPKPPDLGSAEGGNASDAEKIISLLVSIESLLEQMVNEGVQLRL